MFQWFLRLMQFAIVAGLLWGDYVDNFSEGRPGMVLFLGAICAFGATQAALGLRYLWLLLRERRTRQKQLN